MRNSNRNSSCEEKRSNEEAEQCTHQEGGEHNEYENQHICCEFLLVARRLTFRRRVVYIRHSFLFHRHDDAIHLENGTIDIKTGTRSLGQWVGQE